jgi:hypothetical protein
MVEFTTSQWEDAFYAAWRSYLAGVQRQSAAAQALMSGDPRDELVERPSGGESNIPNACQILAQDLFQEARAFHGAVPVATRAAWLKAIEPCKGKIPETAYAEAMAILRGPT